MKVTHFAKSKVHFEAFPFACNCTSLNWHVCEFGLSLNSEHLTLVDLISPNFCALFYNSVFCCDLQDITIRSLLGGGEPGVLTFRRNIIKNSGGIFPEKFVLSYNTTRL